MSLWGNQDGLTATGTSVNVTANSNVVVGTGTSFATQAKPGDVLVISSNSSIVTKGRIAAIANNTYLTLSDVFTGTTNTALGVANVLIQQQPKWEYTDSNRTANGAAAGVASLKAVYGIDVSEAANTSYRAKGVTTPGWIKYSTYTDAQGRTRNKPEVLVAMSTIAGEAPEAPLG